MTGRRQKRPTLNVIVSQTAWPEIQTQVLTSFAGEFFPKFKY